MNMLQVCTCQVLTRISLNCLMIRQNILASIKLGRLSLIITGSCRSNLISLAYSYCRWSWQYTFNKPVAYVCVKTSLLLTASGINCVTVPAATWSLGLKNFATLFFFLNFCSHWVLVIIFCCLQSFMHKIRSCPSLCNLFLVEQESVALLLYLTWTEWCIKITKVLLTLKWNVILYLMS